VTATLEQRLQKLEDYEAIRRLKGLYCQCVDGGWDRMTHDGDAFVELFTDDATMEFVRDPKLGPPARADGRESIRTMINAAQAASYASHNMCGELIDIDGDTAHATWHAMNYLTWPGFTYVGTFIYHEDYVRTPDGWRIKSLRAVCRGIHPLENGQSISGKR
jgi:hypothetical protein